MSKPRLGTGRIPYQLGVSADTVFLTTARITSTSRAGTLTSPNGTGATITGVAAASTLKGP